MATSLAAVLPNAHAASTARFGRQHDQASIIADRLLQAYANRSSLVAIGHAAREDPSVRTGNCPTCLSAALDSFLHHLEWSEADLRVRSAVAIRDRVREEMARDFAGDRILTVQGWLLSETEIKLCAIASLAERPIS